MSKSNFNLIDAVKGEITGTARYASDEERARRLAVCNACPQRNAALNTCGVCHCWLPGKTKYAESSCPQSKW